MMSPSENGCSEDVMVFVIVLTLSLEIVTLASVNPEILQVRSGMISSASLRRIVLSELTGRTV